ncbi:error-prone DNA polymerase [Bradyrhizobium sp. U87765 SZCCT0131]|uniref:error-prone DNA polymerase n=1 Tax=unclassified Bradyrhizobium TaxID=2631580 RepID=UPI001BA4CB8F|nr:MULTISPECIES: error-prone DNA polymerase [unclassified Bradyrhizobium]MBR1222672.1 error-prone DNA polymerase [Bradyrhizobium sp. U87765 SZCCT0131]MBR1265247.1 error-prone DNA polymerase [Bradyrhizobium sp. U87765 SZCCT0134]MBR1302974.1 error-prone DNA polymerase [Bradyrhizobium sp. U87765 SZCCT0110]MBR1323672.1 error-prone DNA polymerase [Bradyrhizobium sp. U87765 SZCCT0109]MBR1346903.1 error-prone DNA polymerase [Bradyrhizobium sp. U87765 SZCCT0048]
MSTPGYAEIGITTNFSFLHGGSHPQEYVHEASRLRLPAIGLADRNTLAGVVRAYSELGNDEVTHKPKLLVGARLVFMDGTPDILVYPRDRAAYGRLCRLLSRGKLAAGKGECHLALPDLLDFSEGQLLVLALPHRFDAAAARALLATLRASGADGVWLAASLLYRGDDRRRLAQLQHIAATAHVPLLATNEVLYHDPGRRPLQDVLTCVREKTTIEAVGRRLAANAERHLKPAAEMARLFRDLPDAVAETLRFADRITFSLSELRYQYPDEPIPPGKTAQQHLQDLVRDGIAQRYPGGIEPKVQKTIDKELALIATLDYAHYFLTVHDIVRYARSKDILCQGRGSAANSAVCYVLGITSVDPTKVDLLFERFLSQERSEPPDIDVDFEHSRREEVMQYVFNRYGRHRAAIVATVIHYRPRSAIRDVGKALGLTEDVTAALADTVWGSWGDGLSDMQIRQAGLDPANPMIRRAVELAGELIKFPRHLSQHVGGFVLTQDRLDTYVPIGNAAMDDRTFIEWDKDDIDALNMMKVDVLALGMLTCIRKCFDLIDDHKGKRWELATIPPEEKPVYDMLSRGESLGVFQVESRAQMNMLPRLRPRTFYDLVIEVAIVRPGPIQGNMVHPYLKRRNGIEKVVYPSPAPEHGPADELENVLGRTLGVPLFQEQAMRIAIEAARFTPDEANQLRRAMATFRHMGTIHTFEQKMIGNLTARGYPKEFAENCFNQIKGFGEYGFPESHAASFAQLVYVSSWLKHFHPDAFACGLLNSQPMGFYAPAQIVSDARKNGVVIRDIDVSFSEGQNTLEDRCGRYHALRLGFRQIDGFHVLDPDVRDEDAAAMRARQADAWDMRIARARARRPFTSLEEFARDTGLPKRALILLADADAFRSLGLDRRSALWAVRRLPDDVPLPLFAAATAREQPDEAAQPLPDMALSEHVVADYQTIRLSLKGHPMQFLRERFTRERVLSCRDAVARPNGARTAVAGVILVRQRPGSAKGVVFLTIEDETGIANIVVWPKVMERFRKEVMGARLVLIEGRIQSAEGVTHLVAERLIDRSQDLVGLANDALVRPLLPAAATPGSPLAVEREDASLPAPKHRHPRNVRILPASRDFH